MRAGGLAVALGIALAVAAGCDTTGQPPGVASAASGGAAPSPTQPRDVVAEIRRWVQCMRDQGIDMPDPGPDGKIVGFDWNQGGKGSAAAEAYARAETACRAYETYQDVERKPLTSEQLALWRDWARCMREHGADQPDPDLYGFEPEQGRGDPAKEAIRESAEAACFDEFLAARMGAVR